MDFQPGNYNFDIYPGTAITDTFTFEDCDGSLIDLTGCSAVLTFKYKNAPYPVLTVLSTEAGTLSIDPVANSANEMINAGISCVTTDEFTSAFVPGRLFFNFIVTQPNNISFVVLKGSGTVYQV